MPNSVTTIFGFSPTGRHETIRITEGDSELIYTFISYECQIYALIVLKTVQCVSHYKLFACIPFLTEKATPTLSLHVVQKCDGLDSDQSFEVTVCLRQCHSLDFDSLNA